LIKIQQSKLKIFVYHGCRANAADIAVPPLQPLPTLPTAATSAAASAAAASAAASATASAACLNRPLSIVSKHHTSMVFRYHKKKLVL
jgi:hypothetical protein